MKTGLLFLAAFTMCFVALVMAYCYFSGRLRFLIVNRNASIELNGTPVRGEILTGRTNALVTIREPGKGHSYQLFFEGDTDFTGDMGSVADCGPWVAPHFPVIPETQNYPPCKNVTDAKSQAKRWPLMDEGKAMRFLMPDSSTVTIKRNLQ